MVTIDSDSEVVRHLTVELAHAATACRCHLLHTTHKLILSDDYRRVVLCHSLEGDVVVNLLILWQLAVEYRAKQALLTLREGNLQLLLLLYKALDNIAIDANKAHLLILTLVPINVVAVELTAHFEHLIPLALSSLDK